MTPSWRKPVGALAILALIVAWCVLVASASRWVGDWPIVAQTLFYVAAGVAWLWLLPMRRMLLWMETGRWK